MIYKGFAERSAWVEVDVAEVARNLRKVRRSLSPETDFMPVIKCNGYGLGTEMMGKTVMANGAKRLATALLSEAVALREAGITVPILVFAYLPPGFAPTVVKYNITQTLYSEEAARALSEAAQAAGQRATVHIKVESGLGRVGFEPNDNSVAAIRRIMALSGLDVEGIYSHFATADEEELGYAYQQLAIFDGFLGKLNAAGVNVPLPHMANSAATIRLPESHYQLTRGAALPCGYYPSPHVPRETTDLRFALSLKAVVSFVKTLPPGSAVGYGNTYVTRRHTRVATLGLGYGDGYLRALSNRGLVLLHGQKVPVIGAVCMDQLMVDVSELDGVRVGDEAVFLGRQGGEEITPELLAELAGTVPLELFAPLHTRLPRLYVKDGQPLLSDEAAELYCK